MQVPQNNGFDQLGAGARRGTIIDNRTYQLQKQHFMRFLSTFFADGNHAAYQEHIDHVHKLLALPRTATLLGDLVLQDRVLEGDQEVGHFVELLLCSSDQSQMTAIGGLTETTASRELWTSKGTVECAEQLDYLVVLTNSVLTAAHVTPYHYPTQQAG